MIFAFEGVDGCGKSTVMNNVKEILKERYHNKNIRISHEPGGTDTGEAIRNILLNNSMDNLSRLFLFEASRIELFESLILPNNTNDDIWLFDRFTLSTLVYQGLKINPNIIDSLNNLATRGTIANHTIILDVDKETMMSRRGSDANVLDTFCFENFDRLRHEFTTKESMSRTYYDVQDDMLLSVKVYSNSNGTDLNALVKEIADDICEIIDETK